MFPGVKIDLVDYYYEVHPNEKRPGEKKNDVVKVQIIQNSNRNEPEEKKCRI